MASESSFSKAWKHFVDHEWIKIQCGLKRYTVCHLLSSPSVPQIALCVARDRVESADPSLTLLSTYLRSRERHQNHAFGNPGALLGAFSTTRGFHRRLLVQAFDVVRMKSPIGGIQLHRVALPYNSSGSGLCPCSSVVGRMEIFPL